MPIRDPQAVLQAMGHTTLKVDTYFLQRTGFVANQTILKLGEYNLNCVPATLALDESRFLAVLTPAEVNHFGRFKAGTHILILTFDDPDKKDIARFHLRVTLVDLVPVPDRKNVCFVTLKLKSLPTELVLFIGDYLEGLQVRKEAWESLAAETVETKGGIAGLEPTVSITGEPGAASATLVSFSTKKLTLTWSQSPGAWAGVSAHLKLTLRGRPVILDGTFDESGAFLPEFQSEWLDFVEDGSFQRKLKAGKGPS